LAGNADLVRTWIEDWNRGDLERLVTDADPAVEWVVAREHPASTTHRGPEQIGAYLQDWLRTMPGMQIDIEDLEESGDQVLVVMRMSGTGAGSGATTEVRVANLVTFRDGKAIRVEEFLDPDEGRRALAAG
jgi:ketosteroid isomerase-like protein